MLLNFTFQKQLLDRRFINKIAFNKMPRRSSRGGQGKDDWSACDKALANILHKEIFETGRYFKKTEVSHFKNKNRRKKNRESPEEDEGFEVTVSIINK